MSKPTDILFICANTRSFACNRAPLINSLRERGLSIAALVPDEEYIDEIRRMGVRTVQYKLNRHSFSFIDECRNWFSLYKNIKCIRPKAIFAYALKPILFGIVAAQFAGVREAYCLVTGLGYLFSTSQWHIRIVRLFVVYWLALAGMLSRVFFFQNADDQSELNGNWLFRRFVHSIVVDGSGVDTKEFEASPSPTDQITFLFMGRFLIEKGITEFVEASKVVAGRHRDVRFIALGSVDESLRNSISRDSLELWLSEKVVEFPGRVRDVRPFLREASVVVLPSYYREGIPRTLLEGLSCGRAIITCDTPGCRETVISGHNGILIPPKSADALVVAMEQLIYHPVCINEMGRKSRALAEGRFADSIIVRKMLNEMSIVEQATSRRT